MTFAGRFIAGALTLMFCLTHSIAGQTGDRTITAEQAIERAYGSVALVMTGRTPGQQSDRVGAAVVVRPNGVLLTAYHVIKDAYSVQVRFKNGEVFDQVQLLGVDTRRDVAAIKVIAGALPALPVAIASRAKAGDAVSALSHPASMEWSVSSGVLAAQRMADEVPGAGTGYRLLQFTAPIAPGSSGGVLLDNQGNALGLIVGALKDGQNINFAVPMDSVFGLADMDATKRFASGSFTATAPVPARPSAPITPSQRSGIVATPDAPEKSDLLSASKDPDFILRNFKTMYVAAQRAQYFKSDQLKASLGRNKEFAKLNIRIVDDITLADTVLDVGYTFAWDFPFELRHQNTTIVVLSGKGVGPFSGVAGARSVAEEFVKIIKKYRIPNAEKQ